MVERHRRASRRVVHRPEPPAVTLHLLGRHPHPAVVHPQGEEQLLSHIAVEGAAVHSAHHLREHRGAGGHVVAGLASRRPARFRPDVADAGDDLAPPLLRIALGALHPVTATEATRVGEAVPDGDAALAVGRELGHVEGYRVVEPHLAPLPQLGHHHRDRRLRHRPPRDELLRRHSDAAPRLTHGPLAQGAPVERDVHLGAEMEAVGDPFVDHLARAGETRDHGRGLVE